MDLASGYTLGKSIFFGIKGGRNVKKKVLSAILSFTMVVTALAGCGNTAASTAPAGDQTAPEANGPAETAAESAAPAAELTGIDAIIAEAETMTMEELAAKAIEESNGKTFYGVGNSSRGKSALPLFIEYLQSIDSSYNMEFEWQQPKNNKIFEQLTSDSLKSDGTFAMTLIQDGNQIQSKMVDTDILKTFIPKEWAEANNTSADSYEGFLPLQTLNKVFMYNSTGSATYNNCWDFVYDGAHPLFMGVDSEIVGKNFLMMLTEDKYATWLKEAYDKLDDTKKAYFEPTIKAMQADANDLDLAQTEHTLLHGSSSGLTATTSRQMTVLSATPL